MSRLFDLLVSFLGLVLFTPILLPIMYLIWKQDGNSPFYIANRIGKNGLEFKMIKLRSMIVEADKTGVDSTGNNDQRITRIGKFIRNYKLDELGQLWNVFKGEMSIVGPRPNVKREVDIYTPTERHLLSVKPGITDFASIVFSDEGDILSNCIDPDIAYNQLIRPAKSMLGLFYIENKTFILDIQLCFLTIMALFSKQTALRYLNKILKNLGANSCLLDISLRRKPLLPMPPPGSNEIVTCR